MSTGTALHDISFFSHTAASEGGFEWHTTSFSVCRSHPFCCTPHSPPFPLTLFWLSDDSINNGVTINIIILHNTTFCCHNSICVLKKIIDNNCRSWFLGGFFVIDYLEILVNIDITSHNCRIAFRWRESAREKGTRVEFIIFGGPLRVNGFNTCFRCVRFDHKLEGRVREGEDRGRGEMTFEVLKDLVCQRIPLKLRFWGCEGSERCCNRPIVLVKRL